MSVNHRYLQKSVQVTVMLEHLLQAWVLQKMKDNQRANKHNVKLNGKGWEKMVKEWESKLDKKELKTLHT